MKENHNYRISACCFYDNAERIEAIRNLVRNDIIVGVGYADKENPVIKLYVEGNDKPFAKGNVGDYVVDDGGTFRIVKSSDFTHWTIFPTLAQAQKWLIDEAGIAVFVIPRRINAYEVAAKQLKHSEVDTNWVFDLWDKNNPYKSYEEALSAGIEYVFQLIGMK